MVPLAIGALAVGGVFLLRGDGCSDARGSYPPESIEFVGRATVSVPFASWACPGYDSEGPGAAGVTIQPGVDGRVSIEAPIRDDAQVEVRFRPAAGGAENGFTSDVPGPWTIATSEPGSIVVRLCTADDRCATYIADVGSS